MKKVSKFIVNNLNIIIILFIIMCIISFVLSLQVKTNYDLTEYLPKDMNSKIGQDILFNEFDINGTAVLMIKDKELYEVTNIKNQIEKINGVNKVIWLDDFVDITTSKSFFDNNITSQFTNNNNSLLQIQFVESSDAKSTDEAITKIKETLNCEYYIAGEAGFTKDMRDISLEEMPKYMLVAVIIIMLIMFLTMESYIEPILILISIGSAIVINQGTNIFVENMSLITKSMAAILQLAVSLDYSIFLIHRYHEEKIIFKNKKEAMVNAISKTAVSVTASALTTIAGFAALILMQYKIGKDIGVVLSKGVLLSVISVLTLLPCIILKCDKYIEKYKHKSFIPNFSAIAKFIIKIRYLTIVLVLIFAIPVFLAQHNLDYYYSYQRTISSNAKSNIAQKIIDDNFKTGTDVYIIIPNKKIKNENKLIEEFNNIKNVNEVFGLYTLIDYRIPEKFIPEGAKNNFQSENYSYYIVNLNSKIEDDITKESINELRNIADKYYDEWYVAGEAALHKDLADVTDKDFSKVTIMSIIFIGVILLISFRSIILPILLIMAIEIAIWINLSIPYFSGNKLCFISFIIIGAIQLGATVDYAILFTSRYKENLLNLLPIDAAQKTIIDSGKSIITSAMILFTGTFSVSLITSINVTKELTTLIGRGALISSCMIFMFLPGLLIIFDKIIRYTTYKWPSKSKAQLNKGK